MRKILLLTMLSVVFILPGCKVLGLNQCTKDRTSVGVRLVPGSRYMVIYQYANPIIIVDRIAKSNGTISVPSYGHPCGSLYVSAVTNSNVALTANPSSVYLPSAPPTATITGHSFDTTYGVPKVDYFDGSGYLVGSVQATSVSSDGTSLQANTPDLSSVYSGTYQVRVSNKTYAGYYTHIVGSATISGWGRDRPDSDGDGWYDDEDCAPYDPYLNYDCSQNCGGPGEPITICQPY